MTHDEHGGWSGYSPDAKTQQNSPERESEACATAHAGTTPWVGRVRVVPYGDHFMILERDDRMVAMVPDGDVADAIAARLNAEPGCRCREVVEAEAVRLGRIAGDPDASSQAARCILHQADTLRAAASRLPAPAAAPVGGDEPRLYGDCEEHHERPSKRDEVCVTCLFGAVDAAQAQWLDAREQLAAKDAELARLKAILATIRLQVETYR